MVKPCRGEIDVEMYNDVFWLTTLQDIRDRSLIITERGATKRVRGQVKFYHYEKGGHKQFPPFKK